jgi:DNA invertase Pin-like site-specific DNA recombinase
MRGNVNGSFNVKHIAPKKEVLLSHIESGMTDRDIETIYKITNPTLQRWYKSYSIKTISRRGNRFFATDEAEASAISKLTLYKDSKLSFREIASKSGIPSHIITKLARENKIELKTTNDYCREAKLSILHNVDFFVKENETKTLKDISSEYCISLEHLKAAFVSNGVRVKLHSYNKSRGELECRSLIESYGFQCNSHMFEKKFEIDCHVASLNFGLEYCGEYWHQYDPIKKNKNKHKDKYLFFKSRGIKLMTIFEAEWKNKREIVKSMLESRLGVSSKLYARKCSVEIITNTEAKLFHNKNHISGYVNSSINVGLFSDGNLVSVLSILKSRFDKLFQYEISRYSTQLGYTVVGGLSKMFKFFIREYDPESCMTYSDLRFGEGLCYEKIGFSYSTTTPPNYFYTKRGSLVYENRMKFMKSKLINMPGYSKEKTEFDIMQENNYLRIYDCGNNKYVWTKC